jgi:hypothetical protein
MPQGRVSVTKILLGNKMYRCLQRKLLLTQKNKRLLLEGIHVFPIPSDYKSLDCDCYFSFKVVDMASRWYHHQCYWTQNKYKVIQMGWNFYSGRIDKHWAELLQQSRGMSSLCLPLDLQGTSMSELWVKHILDRFNTNSNFGFETTLFSFKCDMNPLTLLSLEMVYLTEKLISSFA